MKGTGNPRGGANENTTEDARGKTTRNPAGITIANTNGKTTGNSSRMTIANRSGNPSDVKITGNASSSTVGNSSWTTIGNRSGNPSDDRITANSSWLTAGNSSGKVTGKSIGAPTGSTSRIKSNVTTASLSSKSLSSQNAVRRTAASTLPKQRDSVISVIRQNYKTSPYRLTIDQFTTVLFQSRIAPISPYFLLYKYCHALMMLAALGFCLSLINTDDGAIEWHLILDHWMAVVGSMEALLGVFVVTYFYHHCRTKAMRDSYHISEGLYVRLLIYTIINATTITFIFASSVIFWFFICGNQSISPASIEHGIILNIMLPALLALKMNVENMPFSIDCFMYPLGLMLMYFINIIVNYYLRYRALFNAGEPKAYIFVYFNEKSLLHFLWFTLESLMVTVAVHIFATLIWYSRWLFVRMCCPNRDRRLRREASSSQDGGLSRSYIIREDFVKAIPDLRKPAWKRCLERIADLERSYRHDFIQPEWKQGLYDYPSFMYVFYRAIHLIMHCLMLFISLVEPEKPLRKRDVKQFILWVFYFGNFFLCVSFLQSLCGFAVIVTAYSRKSSLKYFEKSELYVTGFQKFYAAINGCALALAVFTFATSWILIDDTKYMFASHDYTYDVPHVVNPLSMSIDFIIVGHPYKFIYFILSFGILSLNIVFNYWLYHSQITSRTGAKFIYEYLSWENTMTVAVHIAVLYSILTSIHFVLWIIFLAKRTINVAFHRRHLYRKREQTARPDSVDLEPDGRQNPAPMVGAPILTSVSKLTNQDQTNKSAVSLGSFLPSPAEASAKTLKSVKSIKSGESSKIIDSNEMK